MGFCHAFVTPGAAALRCFNDAIATMKITGFADEPVDGGDEMSDPKDRLQILATLDGSDQAEAALRFARAIAAGAAEITVLRVVPEQETLFDPSGLIVIPAEDEFAEQLDRARGESKASVARFDDQPGIGWNVEAVLGDPAETILRLARERDVDLIVMSSTGKGAFSRLTLGSVADRISRTSPVPVMIVRAASEAMISRIVVPTDGSTLAETAIPAARDLALRTQAPIEFIYVVDYSMVVPGGMGAGALTPELHAQLLGDAIAAGQRAVDRAVESVVPAGVAATGKVVRGIPAQTILGETKPGDVVVMSSHGRSGFTRWLIGSVAEKLIRAGSSPVLLVPARKPIESEVVSITI
jgi:nucleotide-binding universal stress UspA family protein